MSLHPSLIVPLINLIVAIIEQGPTILDSLKDLTSSLPENDKTTLIERIKKAQDKWKEWE